MAKTPTAKTPTAKTPTAKTPTAKTPTAKTPTAKTPTAKTDETVVEVILYKNHRLRHYLNSEGYACLEVTDANGVGFRQSVKPGTAEAKKLKEGLTGFLKRLG